MGDAAIWYYPDPSGTVEKIDLNGPFSALDVFAQRSRADGVGWAGRRYTASITSRTRVRVSHERFSGLTTAGRTLARALSSLASHLEGGGNIVIAEDDTLAWAAFATSAMQRADTTITTGGLIYTALFSASPSSGHEVWVQGGYPSWQREIVAASSWASPRLTLSEALRYTYDDGPVLLTQRGTWIALKLPDDQLGRPILTDDGRKTYSLDMELEQDWGVVSAMAEGYGDTLNSATIRHGHTIEMVESITSSPDVSDGTGAGVQQSGRVW